MNKKIIKYVTIEKLIILLLLVAIGVGVVIYMKPRAVYINGMTKTQIDLLLEAKDREYRDSILTRELKLKELQGDRDRLQRDVFVMSRKLREKIQRIPKHPPIVRLDTVPFERKVWLFNNLKLD